MTESFVTRSLSGFLLFMERPRVFLSLQEAQQGISPTNREGAMFGSKPISFVEAESKKPARKMRENILSLQRNAILSNNLTISDSALLHGENGDPTFIQVQGINNSFHISTRHSTYDGTVNQKDKLRAEDSDKNLNVVTGVCLFGASAAEGIGESGKRHQLFELGTISDIKEPIRDIAVDPILHPSEADSILRLNQFLNEGIDRAATVHAHIPRIEYYLYGLSLQDKGVFDSTRQKQWMDAVDKRATGVQKLFSRRSNKDVRIITPLHPIGNYIKGSTNPNLEDMTEILQQDDLWRKLLDKKTQEQQQGQAQSANKISFMDLNYLSYTYAYLRIAQDNGLMVAVENPEEIPIMTHAQKSVTVLDRPVSLVGIYVHPKVITQHGGGREYLYNQPNHDGRRQQSLREIITVYNARKNV